MTSVNESNTDVITGDDTINWKKKYEKEKKAKNKYAKQIEHYKSKLKKANIDITKASNYYRKQCAIFKAKQTELLKHISSTNYSSTKQDIKYVFVEDIKQIKLIAQKRKKTSIQIQFVTGDQAIFNNIDVIDDHNNNQITPDIKSESNKNDIELQAILCQELQKRIEDIDSLINITFEQKYMINDSTDYGDTAQNNNSNNHNNDDISLQMRLNLIEYVNKIKQRHNKYNLYDRIQRENQKRIGAVNNNYLQSLHENNGLWRNLLLNFPIDIVGILSFELNDRIHDVQNVKDVLYKNEEALYENINDIMSDIKYRHNDSFRSWNKTNNTHKMTQKWKHIIKEVDINNARWRKQIYFDSVPTSKINSNQNELENHSHSTNDWLFTDEIRNTFIDSLKVNKHSVHLLTYIGAYLNRIIPNIAVEFEADLYKLYIPIITNDPHNVIITMLDGILFAILINLCERDCIDLRVLQLPNNCDNTSKEPEPLSEISIRCNMRIIFSSLAALNIELPQWSIDDYFDINITVNIMLCIVFQLFSKQLDDKINITAHPQLLRLCQSEAEGQNASFYTWKVWLNKWLLHLKEPKQMPLQPVIHEEKEPEMHSLGNFNDDNRNRFESDTDLIANILHTIDYHDYLILICCRMDDEFVANKLYKNDAHCLLLYECITSKLLAGTETMIKLQDIQSHNPLLQEMLLADIFEVNNGINALSKEEKKIISSNSNMSHVLIKRSAEEQILISWINSFVGDCKLHINNLQYCLCDGVIILRLLDKLKAGCVDWKCVKLRNAIRNKFDALTNCKLIMDACNDNFAFNLVGLNSSDIADGNLKYINKLLYQIMCYSRNILLSEIQFNGKYVTDKMILQWINNRIKNYKKKIKENDQLQHNKLKLITIKSFRENQLNDSILFINLLASIQSEWINYDFVENIPKGNINNSRKEKLLNAKYCITLIRKLGQKIFVIANDICMSDARAILSIFTNIMIIAAKHSDNDQLIN